MSAMRSADVVRLWPRGTTTPQPRLGFLGLGRTGRSRLEALRDAHVAEVIAVADLDPAVALEAALHGGALACTSLGALLQQHLDGVVIATPNAVHAAQAIAALQAGCAVFCRQPLARTATEAAQVVAAAHAHDRLLAVDFSHRWIDGLAVLREQIRAGELGELYAIDLAFHSAYGPDQRWFYDVTQSGGGCVLDLGAHLIDLAAWMTGRHAIHDLDAHLYLHGEPLPPPMTAPEDYASVQYRLGNTLVRLSCSWRMPVGTDAVIGAAFYGTRGGAALRNVGGSFHDFTVERHEGTRRWQLGLPSSAWSGCALVDWARRLGQGGRFDPAARAWVEVAAVVDQIYGR